MQQNFAGNISVQRCICIRMILAVLVLLKLRSYYFTFIYICFPDTVDNPPLTLVTYPIAATPVLWIWIPCFSLWIVCLGFRAADFFLFLIECSALLRSGSIWQLTSMPACCQHLHCPLACCLYSDFMYTQSHSATSPGSWKFIYQK